jgi:hypothetical protein
MGEEGERNECWEMGDGRFMEKIRMWRRTGDGRVKEGKRMLWLTGGGRVPTDAVRNW